MPGKTAPGATRSYGMGWLRELPDHRDYTPETPEIREMLQAQNVLPGGMMMSAKALPASVDLRGGCSPIEDQGTLGSCTAHAAVGLVEYYQRQMFETHIEGSRRFVYKTTRNLLQLTGDTGAYLRSTMGALALFGVPPEKYWPYTTEPGTGEDGFDAEPPAFLYAFGSSYRALKYYRLDPANATPDAVLESIKTHLVARRPMVFGFSVYASIAGAEETGEIPYPEPGDRQVGGHAVAALGFDDGRVVGSAGGGTSTTGAFLIRNSWGTGWGDGGYGWLPYEYLLQGLAVDWWTLIQQDYKDLGGF